ncbi:MAG: hypothetical protein AAF225_13325 [Pseudomonadota bacterium]
MFKRLGASAILFVGSAEACSCLQPGPNDHLRDLDGASAIFEGTVSFTTHADDLDGGRLRKTVFDVTERIMGPASPLLEVFHLAPDGGNCGLSLTPGTTMVIVAYEDRTTGRLHTNNCASPGSPLADYRAAVANRPTNQKR